MKVSYISTYTVPTQKALGVQIANVCASFAHAGVKTMLFVPHTDGRDIFSYYGVSRNFTLTKVPFRMIPVPKHLRYIIRTVLYLRATKKYISSPKDSMVYTREALAGIVFRGHVLEMHTFPQKVTFFHKFLWKRVGSFVVLTSFIKENLVKHGIPKEKIHVAPDAVGDLHLKSDMTKSEAREMLGLPKEKKIIAYVGKYQTPFAPGKGVDELIEAFSIIYQEHPDTFLLLVGINAEFLDRVRKQIEDLSIEKGHYLLKGHVPQQEVVKYLRSADVLVMNYPWSTHHAYEMSSMKLFEYMAAERPIVASRLPSVCEVLTDATAELIEPGNQEALVKAVQDILFDYESAEAKARQARQTVETMTWDTRAKKILDFINL